MMNNIQVTTARKKFRRIPIADQSQQIIHLALALNHTYITPFTVLLTSVLENNTRNRICFHVITSGISEKEKLSAKKYVSSYGSEMLFYEVAADRLQKFVVAENTHMTIANYYRLFFPELIEPEINNLLYLDTDIVVIDDLTELYNTDLGQFAAGAVPEYGAPFIRKDLGITVPDIYFNSGVLLMNLNEWKKQQITERSIKFIYDFPEKIIWADQDALNAVLAGNYFVLNQKYNVNHYAMPVGLKRENCNQFLKDQAIIHYTELKNKPWSKICKSQLRYLYIDYLKQSPRRLEAVRLNFLFYSVRLRRNIKKIFSVLTGLVDKVTPKLIHIR